MIQFKLPASKLTALDQVRRNLVKAVQDQIVKTGNPYEAFESINAKCVKCGKTFTDMHFIPELPHAKRIYCDSCNKEIWKVKK